MKNLRILYPIFVFAVLPLLLCYVVGCEPPQQILPLPQSCQIVLQAFTAESGGWCGPCNRDLPALKAIQASGVCQVVIVDPDLDRATCVANGVNDFPEYRVYVNGSLYYRTNNIKDLYRLMPR